VTPSGSLTTVHPEVDWMTLPVTCTLDLADGGPSTLESIGELLNMTREAVRHIEMDALVKVASHPSIQVLVERDPLSFDKAFGGEPVPRLRSCPPSSSDSV